MNNYKLYGFLNMFNIVPDFTFPIFVCDNKFFFQKGENDKITEFVEIKNEFIDKIVSLDKYQKVSFSCYTKMNINSKPLYSFQIDEDYMVYGTSQDLCAFFSTYKIPNNSLKEEILDFFIETNNIIPMNKSLFYYATGKRKSSIARVRVYYGTGKITINNRDLNDYFSLDSLRFTVKQPLILSNYIDNLDIICNVKGGGVSGQAGAIRLGISKALLEMDASLRPELKKEGFLTRDSRVKERKKYGLKAARKESQYSKR